jgi:hypothetical protein
MFQKFILDNSEFTFDIFKNDIIFEDFNNRKCANIIDKQNELIPLVRTTTKYNHPYQLFNKNHYNLIKKIQEITKMNLIFNNGLVEIYDYNYNTMKYHSDQALDLQDDSYICLYSVYNNTNNNYRCLKIKNKLSDTNLEKEIILDNNSFILFSTNTNKQFLHKIICSLKYNNNINNKWLGITLRCSKTFIKFIDEIPYFTSSGYKLYIANKAETELFYKYKSLENKLTDFIYPTLNYTINSSDLSV